MTDLPLPLPPWQLIHLADSSVLGQPRWEAIFHKPIKDPEFMFESKWGTGTTAKEALEAAEVATPNKTMRYESKSNVASRRPLSPPPVVEAGEIGEELDF